MQIYGFMFTTIAKGAFLIRASIIFTPLLCTVAGEAVPAALWAGSLLGFAGSVMISLDPSHAASGSSGAPAMAGQLPLSMPAKPFMKAPTLQHSGDLVRKLQSFSEKYVMFAWVNCENQPQNTGFRWSSTYCSTHSLASPEQVKASSACLTHPHRERDFSGNKAVWLKHLFAHIVQAVLCFATKVAFVLVQLRWDCSRRCGVTWCWWPQHPSGPWSWCARAVMPHTIRPSSWAPSRCASFPHSAGAMFIPDPGSIASVLVQTVCNVLSSPGAHTVSNIDLAPWI